MYSYALRRSGGTFNAEVCAAGAMRVIMEIQNEPLLELHQLDRLTNLTAFWDFVVRLNEGTNLFAAFHNNVTLRRVIFDNRKSFFFSGVSQVNSVAR